MFYVAAWRVTDFLDDDTGGLDGKKDSARVVVQMHEKEDCDDDEGREVDLRTPHDLI